jgi:predicted transcriptional regulator
MRAISEIKRLRKLNDLTQSELSRLAGVSQSLVAKIESGNIDASYTNIQKIFDCLDALKQKKELKAADVMTRKIYSIAGKASVSEAVRKMRQHEISQIPVVESGKVLGLITETDIIARISGGRNPAELLVMDAAEEAPPTISGKAPLSAVTELLKYAPLVLVLEKGRLKGVITKADVLYRLSNP